MQIKVDGLVKDTTYDLYNKGKYCVEVELEEDIGKIVLYNVEYKDVCELNINNEIEIKLDTFIVNLVLDDSYNVHIKRKCTVFVDDIYFNCCVIAPSINVIKD